MIKSLKNKVIVSVQAMPNEPLYKEDCMFAMMQSVVNGGASALRVAGARDVKNAKTLGIPVIGLTKPDGLPENWKEIVYITPTLKEVNELIDAGADVVAFDGATYDEAMYCAELGVDIISTTLSGYTQESLSDSDTPDFELLQKIVENTDVPVILEGRIWEPSQVDKAFELGAYCVVIGSAITRPQLITKRFIER